MLGAARTNIGTTTGQASGFTWSAVMYKKEYDAMIGYLATFGQGYLDAVFGMTLTYSLTGSTGAPTVDILVGVKIRS